MTDLNTATVEVLDHHAREARECLSQGHVDGGGQISAGTLEGRVFGFDDVEDDITRFLIRLLVGFAFQDDFVSLSV